jgi:four helix bundle protein
MVRPHYKFQAWKAAMALVKDVYTRTREFPKEEVYGLVSQMRRAAVSIDRGTAKEAEDR